MTPQSRYEKLQLMLQLLDRIDSQRAMTQQMAENLLAQIEQPQDELIQE